MDEIAQLQRQLDQAEQLLNLVDALRPDLPGEELYELALQALCGAGEYTTGTLWIFRDGSYHCAASQGLDRARAARMHGITLDTEAFQRLLEPLESLGDLHWHAWPLPPAAPDWLRPAEGAGHTLILPLAFTDRIGFATLEASRAPREESWETLRRFADKVAVALDTARIVQEHVRTISELQDLSEQQRQLQEMVLVLSAPVLPLVPGVLVLPLIGSIEAFRAERILEAELDAIIREQAQVVLVDITGTPVVDTSVAMQLVRSAEAARLLGCRTVLVGVRPEIAQTLVGLGVDLHGISTRATLADGLQEALAIVGQRIVRVK